METIYFAFAVSVLRTALTVAGGWLVTRGLADEPAMREVAAGLAVLIVTQAWAFVRIHRRTVYERWLVVLGLEAEPTADPAMADSIKAEAKVYARQGMRP
jgi:hypothetical protein